MKPFHINDSGCVLFGSKIAIRIILKRNKRDLRQNWRQKEDINFMEFREKEVTDLHETLQA